MPAENPKPQSVTAIVTTYNSVSALMLSVRSLFRQSRLPDEIVIADDGSDKETEKAVDTLKNESPVPLKYVWHQDEGFRRSVILNKAFAQSSGDYLLQIDGDCILEAHYIEDHLTLAQKGTFVCGSRVMLSPEDSADLCSGKLSRPSFSNVPIGFCLNAIRIRPLMKFMATRFATHDFRRLRGANMAFWKTDIIAVNGYNEDIVEWGSEDVELAYRLHFLGIQKQTIKFGAVMYHLYHKPGEHLLKEQHWKIINDIIARKATRCEHGIEQYLQ